jgi:UDP-2,3-diacylglucosamine pyrophosphatase LpxH
MLNISEAKQNGTISWVAIKDEFHQETGFDLHKDYFRSVFKNIKIDTATIGYMHVEGTELLEGKYTTTTTNTPFQYINGNEDKTKGTKLFTFTADNIPTEEEIVNHFNIDLTKYRISQIWHKTTPGGKYSISVNLQALKGNETINLDDEFILKLNNLQPINQLQLPLITDKPKACLIIPKQDAHWDKMDIDGNNSIEDRFSTFTKTMLYQLEKVQKTNTLEKIIYIVGSDEFNSEWTSQTTKGTPQQNTMSYQKAFEKVSEFSIEFIKLLRFYTQKIEVVLLNGNHDHNVSWHLSNLLKHVFSKNESITIDTELNNTKIVEYSSSLILLNHGDEMKPKDLATKFPIIAKDKWSQFDNYFVLSGDKHHEQAYDYNGVRTYQVPQLSKAKSLWDDKKGHLCSKAELVTFLFEEEGLSNILRKEIK